MHFSDLFEEFPPSDDLLADISRFSTDSDVSSVCVVCARMCVYECVCVYVRACMQWKSCQ